MRTPIPFPSRSGNDTEWLGGRFQLPAKVREGELIVHPSVDLWLEIPSGMVVGIRMLDPRSPASFAEGLQETMAHPAEGPGRQPARIRVANSELAQSLRSAVGKEIDIRVAPVPELDEVVASLTEHLAQGEAPRYLDDDMAPAVVGSLFAAAARLFAQAPWKHVDEGQLLRVDIPTFAIEGAALCIIGGAGRDFGLLLFRTPADYERFTVLAAGGERPAQDVAVAQWSLLSLSFNKKRDTPPNMLDEIAGHRWTVAGPKAYPMVMAIGPDASPSPFTERDYRIMTACTDAFVDFFSKHRGMFDKAIPKTHRESFLSDGQVTVTLTAPYGEPSAQDFRAERCDDFDMAKPVRDPSVGRNDPCPCGSGQKYKKCHLDAGLRQTVPPEGESVHAMDNRLVQSIVGFAILRHTDHWLRKLEEGIDNDADALQLFVPWVAWTAEVDQKRIAATYLEQKGLRLSDVEREWFSAQLTAWLSLWEVTHVEPGMIEVRDLLTGERRSVREELGSNTLVVRDTLLARVIDFRGMSYFGGMYGRSLPPREACAVADTTRARLRVRKGNVSIDRLRDAVVGRQMIYWWSEALASFHERLARPPVLTNTDGDPLLFVTDSFPFQKPWRAEIERRLGAMDEVDSVSVEDGQTIVVFARPGNRMHKSWENTVTGRVTVAGAELRIDTNSESRADALRRRVRDACAGLIGEGKRKKESTARMARRAKGRPFARKGQPPAPEALEALRTVKEAHYRDWIDTPVPALGGKTPRAAARAKKSRAQLDLLLRTMENHEGRLPENERFDINRIRTELGMEE